MRWRKVAWSGAAALLGVSMMAVGSGPANAVDPYPLVIPPGTAQASGGLPDVFEYRTDYSQALAGNASGVSYTVSVPTPQYYTNAFPTAQTNYQTVGYFGLPADTCTWTGSTDDIHRTVAEVPTTITFSEPVTDPSLMFALGSTRQGGGNADGWTTQVVWRAGMSFTAIDGAPVAGRITPVNLSGESFDGETWAPSQLSGMEYNDTTGGVSFRVQGTVTSVSYTAIGYCRWPLNTVDRPSDSIDDASLRLGLTVAVQSSDLQVSTSAPASVTAGSAFEYSTTVTNAGSGASRGFVVRSAVPEGVVDARLVDPPAGCALVGMNVECVAAPGGRTVTAHDDGTFRADLVGGDTEQSPADVLAAGATFPEIRIAGTVSPTRTTPITTSTTVSGVDSDPDTADNTAVTTTDVLASALTTTKRLLAVNGEAAAATTPVSPGDVLTYEIATENVGTIAANTIVTEQVPVNTAYVGDSGSWSCPAETIAGTECTVDVTVDAASSVASTFTVRVLDSATVSSIDNTVTSTGDPTCTACSTSNPLVIAPPPSVGGGGEGVPDVGASHGRLAKTGASDPTTPLLWTGSLVLLGTAMLIARRFRKRA
ncbi:LPXTG cell wall anchor domain-containing protein [Plantibacter sp. ME-Dv--P-122b]|uniref:LPXTG cell wall anchor domain-containing protein n=1 Tax=Plantibacter sp. ME-Dv--P-122b TaxID=3040300 RepID=UPI00255088FC|nr:LPXTG cell wall anchor domain-containing protein [Plantibacter sp. ME-Dv--P-122b]